MSPIGWMIAAGFGSWAVIFAAAGPRVHPELLLGMLGPLVATCGTWVVAERAYRRDPASLSGVMIAGLVVKAVFFGAYVTLMLRALDARPVPFVAGFTGYFVVLYGMEALFLKRLFAGGMSRRSNSSRH